MRGVLTLACLAACYSPLHDVLRDTPCPRSMTTSLKIFSQLMCVEDFLCSCGLRCGKKHNSQELRCFFLRFQCSLSVLDKKKINPI